MIAKKYIRPAVYQTAAYHLDAHPGIKLNQNESPWDIPLELKVAISQKMIQAEWNRYPLGTILGLKKKLAKLLKVWPDQLAVANGSNVLIQAILMAASINEKVLIFEPGFGVYRQQAEILGNEVIVSKLDERFNIDLNHTLKLIAKHKPKVIFLSQPNAPTGNLFSDETIEEIIKKSSGLVVIDEAYFPFSNKTYFDWLARYDQLIILRTFSKAFALGGIRFGYLMAEPEIANQIEKCLLPFCLNQLTIAVIETVIEKPDYVKGYVEQIITQRDYVYRELMKLNSIKVYPSRANFILFEVDQPKKLFEKLVKKGVVIRQIGKRYLRVSIGDYQENEKFLEILKTSQ